jgi:hypothetical protein
LTKINSLHKKRILSKCLGMFRWLPQVVVAVAVDFEIDLEAVTGLEQKTAVVVVVVVVVVAVVAVVG